MTTVVSSWNLLPFDWHEKFGTNLELEHFSLGKYGTHFQVGDMVCDRLDRWLSGMGVIIGIDKERPPTATLMTVLWSTGKSQWTPPDETWLLKYKLSPEAHEKKRGRHKR